MRGPIFVLAVVIVLGLSGLCAAQESADTISFPTKGGGTVTFTMVKLWWVKVPILLTEYTFEVDGSSRRLSFRPCADGIEVRAAKYMDLSGMGPVWYPFGEPYTLTREEWRKFVLALCRR